MCVWRIQEIFAKIYENHPLKKTSKILLSTEGNILLVTSEDDTKKKKLSTEDSILKITLC